MNKWALHPAYRLPPKPPKIVSLGLRPHTAAETWFNQIEPFNDTPSALVQNLVKSIIESDRYWHRQRKGAFINSHELKFLGYAVAAQTTYRIESVREICGEGALADSVHALAYTAFCRLDESAPVNA